MFRLLLVYGVSASFHLVAHSSSITVFRDAGCAVPLGELQGPNGYTDGQCSRLGAGGDFLSFEITELDDGCNVTIYGNDTSSGICSPEGRVVTNPGVCYTDSDWTYYSIDMCATPDEPDDQTAVSFVPVSSSSTSPATLSTSTGSASSTDDATSSATSPTMQTTTITQLADTAESTAPISSDTSPSSSSETSTGAIVGGVVAGAIGGGLIVGLAWFLLRRRQKRRAQLAGGMQCMSRGAEMAHRAEMPAKQPAVELYDGERAELDGDQALNELGANEAVGREEKGRGRWG